MCGITGIISKSIENNSLSAIEKMTDSMHHRGPNSEGIWSQENVFLGHRRLSIIDTSDSSNQPFLSSCGRYVMVYNGEIYNYSQIKSQLQNKYNFETKSDTEVLMYAFIEWREKSLKYLNGMFAFAIWDKKEKSLFVARDRMGIKPLYYYKDSQNFIFGSEVTALLNSDCIPRELNTFALNEYFQYQTVAAPSTLVKNIHQLMPGNYAWFKNNNLESTEYWSLFKNNMHDVNPNESLNNVKKSIKEMIFESVEKRTISDVPLGAFLSGGIDSSAIIGVMSGLGLRDINALTVSFEDSKFDESNFAKIVAKKYNVNHEIIKISPKSILKDFESILNSFDLPSGDGINSYVVSRAVKNHGITVALSGLGGDELFCGYNSFKTLPGILNHQWLNILPTHLRLIFSNLLKYSGKKRVVKFSELLSEDRIDVENTYKYFRQTCSKSELLKLIPGNTNIMSNASKLISQNSVDFNQFNLLSQISIAEIVSYSQPLLLRDADQTSMKNSLEVRVPFFDHNLVEYMISLPDNFKNTNYPKQLLVESLGNIIPDEIVQRKKMGFTFPWDIWFRTSLKTFIEKTLYSLSSRDFVNKQQVDDIWNKFKKNPSSQNWSLIMSMISLELWIVKNKITY